MGHFLRIVFPLLLVGGMFPATAQTQVLKGRITDSDGNAIDNASLFVKESMLGAVANKEGEYELKIAKGTYTCIFQCLGYETQTKTVTIDPGIVEHDVVLNKKVYAIAPVIITAGEEDPAYRIMRRAIAMAPYYMNQVSEYKAEVYLKGSLQAVKISKIVRRLGKDWDVFKKGTTYVDESFNEIEFTAPKTYKRRIKRQQSSIPGSDSGGGGGPMQLITISMYDPQALPLIISPLSTSAFSHYRFQYEGSVEENGRTINKIEVIPRRKSQQLVSGHIYIADDYWNIHHLDLTGRMKLIAGFSVRLQVNYGEVHENVWMPVSHNITLGASLMGSHGIAQFVSSIKYNSLVENESMRMPDAASLDRQSMAQQESVPQEIATSTTGLESKIANLLDNENLSNRDSYRLARQMQKETDVVREDSLDISATMFKNFQVTEDSAANKLDTAFWATVRPVPLNTDEQKGYDEKEGTTQQPKDTTATPAKPRSLFSTILNGKRKGINLGEKGGTLYYRGITPSQIGFNTVDGFFVGMMPFTYSKSFSGTRGTSLSIKPEAVWAINRKTVMWDVDATLAYAPMLRGVANISFGQTTKDYGGSPDILALENTVASLFFRRNYLKLYEDNFVEVSNSIDIANGLTMHASAKYSRRNMLDNISDYSFFYRDSREYTSNVPVNVESTLSPADHTAAIFSLGIEYTPRYYYRVYNNRKEMVHSDFPTFSVHWRKGVKGVLGSESDFDHIGVGVRQNVRTGLMQRFEYSVNGGIFMNNSSVSFPDFKHFSTVYLPASISANVNRSFTLLEYYRYSTRDKYVEAHAYYEAPFLLLKLLPFFSNRLWQEGVQFNYLCTPQLRNYMEVGYSIGQIWRAGIFAGFKNFKYRSFGVKVWFPIMSQSVH